MDKRFEVITTVIEKPEPKKASSNVAVWGVVVAIIGVTISALEYQSKLIEKEYSAWAGQMKECGYKDLEFPQDR